MIVGLNVTQRMLPVRVFSIASPPPGTLFATRTAAAEATTYTMPMNASCGTRRSSRGDERVRANNRRSEEHTSELQSPCNLVCRLLLENKKKKIIIRYLEIRSHNKSGTAFSGISNVTL